MTTRNPEFTLEEAQDKGEQKASESLYWENKNSWVVKTEKGTYLVSKERIVELPDMDIRVFIVITSDFGKSDFILPLSGYEQFGAKGPRIEGPGYFNPGTTQIPHETLLSLFSFVKEKKDKISVLTYDPTGLGKKFYLLVGEFDEKKRREIVRQGAAQ